jgi:hypothetical protein
MERPDPPPPPPLDRRPVEQPRRVYRFVQANSAQAASLASDFRSDLEAGKRPFRREKVYPELREGMSAFGSLAAARAQWQLIRKAAEDRGQQVKAGDFVAEVLLESGQGFDFEDLEEPDEHLTVWGAADRLAEAVTNVYPASIPEG